MSMVASIRDGWAWVTDNTNGNMGGVFALTELERIEEVAA